MNGPYYVKDVFSKNGAKVMLIFISAISE